MLAGIAASKGLGFFVRGQPDAGLPQPPDALVASGAAEHEVDRRQYALPFEDLHDLLAPGCVDTVMTLPPTVPGGRPAAAGTRSHAHLLLVE